VVFQAQADLQVGALPPNVVDQVSVNVLADRVGEAKPAVGRYSGQPSLDRKGPRAIVDLESSISQQTHAEQGELPFVLNNLDASVLTEPLQDTTERNQRSA
jgi:hypothetical protein